MKKERKPYGHYKKQSDFIVNKADPAIKAKITHWDYFYVERHTGFLMDNAFTATFLNPNSEGWKITIAHCSDIGAEGRLWDWV